MRLSVSETSKLSGVSVRTLHYYDEIGLLMPSEISSNGYRFYNDECLSKLQQIMFLKELEFSLKDIKQILQSPNFNQEEAFLKQKQLLKLRRKRIDKLIKLLDANLKGINTMNEFNSFDTSEIESTRKKYVKEAKERWSGTDEYKCYEEKTKKYSNSDWDNISGVADKIFKEFAVNSDKSPESEVAQELVLKWQQYITDNYYTCSKEILASLSEMYIKDHRFKNNINKYGENTAEFMSKAIKYFCIT